MGFLSGPPALCSLVRPFPAARLPARGASAGGGAFSRMGSKPESSGLCSCKCIDPARHPQ